VYMLLRGMYALWFLGALILIIVAVADVLFGSAPFPHRVSNFLPRVVVSILWPLALLTPRGRYLLWAKWRSHQ
jgi:hypothetical protein